jgi:hypothetical protein
MMGWMADRKEDMQLFGVLMSIPAHIIVVYPKLLIIEGFALFG